MQNEVLLKVKDLVVHYETHNAVVEAVNNVSFEIKSGQTLGLVGETGAGKTTIALAIMSLLPKYTGHIIQGSIEFDGKDITKLSARQRRSIRGRDISMIFQDPMSSLNPVIPVAEQISELIRLHQHKSRVDAAKQAREILKKVGIQPERATEYPHQFSGGMKQRVVIAMALACNPKLIIADEPTTALDVTIQAQILELMQSLQKKLGMAIIMVTHDLGVIAEMCDEIVVMYGGRFCERGTADEIFYNPRHEYTRGLLRSIPNITNMKERLVPISGTPINMLNMPKGCAFCARCDKAMKICLEQVPEERIINESHRASCWINTRDNIGTVEEAE